MVKNIAVLGAKKINDTKIGNLMSKINHDLEAFRCPDATILMRRALDAFCLSENTKEQLVLDSIEPSLENNIRGYIEHNSLPLNVDSITKKEIKETDILLWEEKFDEEDYEDVSVIYSFSITKKAS